MRSFAAGATREGYFRIDPEDVWALWESIRLEKSFDPTLAVYASYAFFQIHRSDLVAEMVFALSREVGFVPFDIAMLAAGPARNEFLSRQRLVPVFPLLSQGWALMPAFGSQFNEVVSSLGQHLQPSVWTLFDETGASIVREQMMTGV